ncbi:Hypothetical predicted protein [Lecanosticta acicola]|uniref:RCC1-like domain-containing protein n=1 Tax=Lecanosticta acicola TaxID=111012 RepID=A0AAI9E7E7_9PEZI|nr:Hypothetical predicted protein [Lecanosticta acicola]
MIKHQGRIDDSRRKKKKKKKKKMMKKMKKMKKKERSFGSVAQIKYIKNKKPAPGSPDSAMAAVPPTSRERAAQQKYAAKQAAEANTKAKITRAKPEAEAKVTKSKAPAKSKAAAAEKTKAAPKGRGKAKKDTEAETDGETKTKKNATKAKGTTKKAAPKKTPAASSTTSKKRKAEDGEAPAAPAKRVKLLTKGPEINQPPTERLHVYVFGEGTAGELALGTAKNAVDVKRPRLNPNLSAETVGVVQVAAGGMHCVALTHDNKVLTWGVNDQGTLGRDTEWDGGLKDMDDNASDSDDEDGDDNGLNPKECTPGEVDWSKTDVAEGTRFVQVAAGDSTSFVLTDDGRVYGWGTFRGNDGIFGFTPDVKVAYRPVLVPNLSKVTDIKAGANHALAIDSKGAVYAWGSGQQNQLGRRIIERTKAQALIPSEFGLPKGPKKGITSIATGSYHSFAISKTGDVYSWGLNNFGETGIMDNAGQDDAVIMNPQVVKQLRGKNIVSIQGGGHHSIASTEEGDCLVWGRIDGAQTGIAADDIAKLPADAVIKDEHGRPRILSAPQKVTAIKGEVCHVTTSSDHNIVLTKQGKAWSWGFSANYQTGLGTDDDVPVATMIDNTAVRDKKLTGATTGGQFSVLTAPAGITTNGDADTEMQDA